MNRYIPGTIQGGSSAQGFPGECEVLEKQVGLYTLSYSRIHVQERSHWYHYQSNQIPFSIIQLETQETKTETDVVVCSVWGNRCSCGKVKIKHLTYMPHILQFLTISYNFLHFSYNFIQFLTWNISKCHISYNCCQKVKILANSVTIDIYATNLTIAVKKSRL